MAEINGSLNASKSIFTPANGKQDHATIEMDGFDVEGLIYEEEKEEIEKQREYLSKLSFREMESLTSLCDTFLPSIHCSSNEVIDNGSVAEFFATSASMAGTPQRLGGLLSGKLKHPKLYLIRLSLWALSTWIGTLILCGRKSLTAHFPYFNSFSQLSPQTRQDILLSWSRSFFSLLRMLYLALKFLSLLVFFSQVNEKNENVSWKAIDYCGPDPNFKNQPSKQTEHKPSKEQEKETKRTKEDIYGPLHKGIVNLKQPQQTVATNLRQLGFPVTVCRRNNIKIPPSSQNPSLIIKCDAVVLGSGSGGGVVAGVLANSGYKVLVLEKGSYLARSNLSLLEGPTMEQMYLGSGLLPTEDMGVLILAGSTVGGGSTVNWSASIRTPQHVLNEWSRFHDLELFESRLYKEAMDVVCEKMGVQSKIENEGFNNMILRKGCEELGYPVNTIPRNSQADHYCGWCCLGCKDGKKKGTAETWLLDMVNSGNGAILPECEAIEVLHKQKKGKDRSTATGVAFEFEYKGVREVCLVESKVTIASCGALCTPVLLKRSGLKNPNIGKNLHLHPVAMAWGYFPDDTDAPVYDNIWPESSKKSYEGGIMTAMSSVVGNFEGSGYGAVIQTPSLHPGMFSVLMPWVSGSDIKRRMCKYSRTAHVFALARDKGSGEIHSASKINYRMDQSDEQNLNKGLEKILRILAAAGAEEIGTHRSKGKTLKVKKESNREFEKFVKEESSRGLRDLSMPICSAHQMGSCRMGVHPKGSVVNPRGETWEMEGLYVADSSLFPTALGVNPMVTIMAIAYCTAQSVLDDLKRKNERY
ncbi:hypothetical protein LguiB_028299 [Lonicera macranthoides]